MKLLRILVAVTALVAVGVFIHGVNRLDNMRPFPTVKCFTQEPVDKVDEVKYPVGTFEHEHKRTI